MRVQATALLLLLLVAAVTRVDYLVKGETSSFESWMSVGKYAIYSCTRCGFSFLNSSGLTDYTLDVGSTRMSWHVVSLNGTAALVDVNLSAVGEALRTCPNCYTKSVFFSFNETREVVVGLSSGFMYYNNTYFGTNPFWLSSKPLSGEYMDAGIAITNSGSTIPLTAKVTDDSSLRWGRVLTLNISSMQPYIFALDSYNPDSGYALQLFMPGVPALPDDTLRLGHFRVNNQSITGIAGFPLAVMLHLHYLPDNIFVLSHTNIVSQGNPNPVPEFLDTRLVVLLASVSAVLGISLLLAWRHKLKLF
jgi:hypothetical protein